MSPELALKLVSIFEGYFTIDEFRELMSLFDVKLESLDDFEPKWLSIARELITKLEHGNSRRLLDSLLDFAESRNTDGIAHTSWERQEFHLNMASVIQEAQKLLEASAAPSEITVAAGNVFSGSRRSESSWRLPLERSSSSNHTLAWEPLIASATLRSLSSC